MRSVLFLTLPILVAVACTEPQKNQSQNATTMSDSTLAKQLGADDYGMKQYTLIFLKRGPQQDIPADSLAMIQQGHLKYMRRQMDEGHLLLLGPLLADEEIRGICIYNTSPEQALEIANSDPALKAGHMVAEAFPWYGSASLQQVPELHKQVEKKSFSEIQ